jgi:hypothetical protein
VSGKSWTWTSTVDFGLHLRLHKCAREQLLFADRGCEDRSEVHVFFFS